MAITEQISKKLEIPFKDFQAGKIIVSSEINDNMKDIEYKVNQIIDKHNATVVDKDSHISNVENPHGVTAHQVGTYTKQEIDLFVRRLEDLINSK